MKSRYTVVIHEPVIIESQTIPGRNGNLIFETGSYENRVGTASCFCLQKDVEMARRWMEKKERELKKINNPGL